MTTLRLSAHHHRLSPILVAGLAFVVAMLAVASLAAAHEPIAFELSVVALTGVRM